MKRLKKAKWFSLCVTVVILVSTFIIPVAAATTLDVLLNSINIEINGNPVASVGQTMTLSNGNIVPFSIIYEGTTYLPLGKLAELFDKNALYDSANNTAVITDKRAAHAIAIPKAPIQELTVTLDSDNNYIVKEGEWKVGLQIPAGRYEVRPMKDRIGQIMVLNPEIVVNEMLIDLSEYEVDDPSEWAEKVTMEIK